MSKFIVILLIIFVGFSCKPISNVFSQIEKEKWIKKGNVYYDSFTKTTINEEVKEQFYTDVHLGKDAKLKILTYTKDDEPIIAKYQYKNGKFTSVIDYRKDKYAPKKTGKESYFDFKLFNNSSTSIEKDSLSRK